MRASAQWRCQSHEGISLRMPFEASHHLISYDGYYGTDGGERYRHPVPLPSPHVVDVKHQPTHGYVIYSFFFHISCPLLHNFIDLKLTDLWSLCQITFLGPEKRENHLLIPRPEMHLMPKHVSALCWPCFWRRHRFVYCALFLPIYIVLLPHFPSFHFGWSLRERQRETIAFDFVDLSSVTLSTVSLQAFLQSVTFNSKFLFPYIFSCC